MRIFWTNFATNELKKIFLYYKETADYSVAESIKTNIFIATNKLIAFPNCGQVEESLTTLKQAHRYILANYYKIIYKIDDDIIYITDIFDSRQNPDKLPTRSN